MAENQEEQGWGSLDMLAALTTSIIAAFLAVSSILNNGSGDDLLTNTLKASQNWSYFQSKSIKQNLQQSHVQSLKLTASVPDINPVYKEKLESQIRQVEKKIAVYELEKDTISGLSKEFEAAAEKADKQGNYYDLAEGFYQISIVLAAIAVLAKKKPVWILSTLLGITAICFTCIGYIKFI